MRTGKQARILYVLKILWLETDEEHPLTAGQIVKKLSTYGITCERKSVYRDLEELEAFGFDILTNQRGSFLGSRIFELPELQILMDAVQSAKFVTQDKTEQMIHKLGMLTTQEEAKGLKKQVLRRTSAKTENESIYYNVDLLLRAFQENTKISFSYYVWSVDGRLVPKKNGQKYVISPWFLQWEGQQYYLIGYDSQANQMKHFRLDKMKYIEMLHQKREGKEVYDGLNLEEYSREHFRMYQGERLVVTLQCENALAGAMLDHFGTALWMHAVDAHHFSIVVSVIVSDKFFGWIASYGGKIRIMDPISVREQFHHLLSSLLECEENDKG
ncbi:MAG: WYL domain-containing protein [Eubacteriales bacterium]|nr:WYL domain-containing protein [Eubacteriales bacterium]